MLKFSNGISRYYHTYLFWQWTDINLNLGFRISIHEPVRGLTGYNGQIFNLLQIVRWSIHITRLETSQRLLHPCNAWSVSLVIVLMTLGGHRFGVFFSLLF